MGTLFNCCEKKSSKKPEKNKRKEEKKQVYPASMVGLKRDKDQTGQDTVHLLSFELGPNIKYFAVYDGHGPRGQEASVLVKQEVETQLINDKRQISKFKERKEVEKYFKKVFTNIQNKFKKKAAEYEISGSCAICVLIIENDCFIINLGDSRAVIGAKQSSGKVAMQMSIDHKANREDEKKRIEETGGTVSVEKQGGNGPARVYSQKEDGPGLAVSRSLGDLMGHQVGVISDPEVSHKVLEADDKFIIIGSDGVWDVMNSAEVVGFIFEKSNDSNKDKVVDFLVTECRHRWEVINMYKAKLHSEKFQPKDGEKSGKNTSVQVYSIDDISAILCYFNIDESK